MRASLAALFLLASACDEVFDLEEVTPPDAPPPCENATPFGTSCRMLDVPITSDTFISQAQPDTPLGMLDALHISPTDRALLKFSTVGVDADERIAGIRLTLMPYWRTQAKLCSTDGMMCNVCPAASIEGWDLHWAITGWNQLSTTWNVADDPNVPWTRAGADAIPDDRSPVVISGAPPAANTALVIDVPADALLTHSPNCYRDGDRLAVLITLTGSAYFGSSEPNLCAIDEPPTMQLTLCR